jgi:sulfite oxidase
LQVAHPLDPLCGLLAPPSDQFFANSHGSVPTIDLTSFRLSVRGDIVSPLRFSLNDLRECFSLITILSKMRCGVNKCRNLAEPDSPGSESYEFGRASGNAIWGGASLQEVLLAAGIKNSARYAVFTEIDPITPEHGAPLRLIISDEEGARGVKWLSEINLLAYPLTNNLRTRFRSLSNNEPAPLRVLAAGELSINEARR